MTIKEKFGECTADDCRLIVETLSDLDKNITVGDLVSFLKQREADAEIQSFVIEKELTEKLTGKCFRVTHESQHIVLLLIESIIPEFRFGETDAVLIGEQIALYKNGIEHRHMGITSQQRYSSHFSYAEEYIEISIDVFQKARELYHQTIKSI